MLTWHANVARYIERSTKLSCMKKVEDWNCHFKSLGMKMTPNQKFEDEIGYSSKEK